MYVCSDRCSNISPSGFLFVNSNLAHVRNSVFDNVHARSRQARKYCCYVDNLFLHINNVRDVEHLKEENHIKSKDEASNGLGLKKNKCMKGIERKNKKASYLYFLRNTKAHHKPNYLNFLLLLIAICFYSVKLGWLVCLTCIFICVLDFYILGVGCHVLLCFQIVFPVQRTRCSRVTIPFRYTSIGAPLDEVFNGK